MPRCPTAATDDVVMERAASMRYAGQKLQELIVHLPDGPVDAGTCAEMERRFTAEYARLYSEAAVALFQAIEIFNLRVSARVPSSASMPVAPAVGTGDTAARPRVRDVHWPGHGRRSTRVVQGPPQTGASIDGPAIVELEHTSVAIAPGQQLHAAEDGTLILTL